MDDSPPSLSADELRAAVGSESADAWLYESPQRPVTWRDRVLTPEEWLSEPGANDSDGASSPAVVQRAPRQPTSPWIARQQAAAAVGSPSGRRTLSERARRERSERLRRSAAYDLYLAGDGASVEAIAVAATGVSGVAPVAGGAAAALYAADDLGMSVPAGSGPLLERADLAMPSPSHSMPPSASTSTVASRIPMSPGRSQKVAHRVDSGTADDSFASTYLCATPPRRVAK